MISRVEIGILSLYYLLFAVLFIYALHRLNLVRLRCRLRNRSPHCPPLKRWPHLAVQLPLFNEPRVVQRLIEAVCTFHYSGRLEIQVLDDSTDATTAIAAACVSRAAERGIEIHHIRRGSRTGYKAGALAEGMRLTTAELFAIFDADFLPSSNVLQQIVGQFADERVGMVQARWGHLNRGHSILTRVQALYLDAHFAVESGARFLDGRFFNFNGTAGVWRRKAIEDAGGWSASTLTEDLDLSYRAQMAGWKFVFLPEVEVAGELPETIGGFQLQQHRWAKGSVQTGRKLLGPILTSAFPGRIKAETFFHLTGNSTYLVTLLLALLLVPALEIRGRLDSWLLALVDLLLFGICSWSLFMFCREGQRQIGQSMNWRHLAMMLPLGIAMSVSNSHAVLEGLFSNGGKFRRTFKRGAGALQIEEPPRLPVAEALLSFFYAFSAIGFAQAGRWIPLIFLSIFFSGFAYLSLLSGLEWVWFLKRQTK